MIKQPKKRVNGLEENFVYDKTIVLVNKGSDYYEQLIELELLLWPDHDFEELAEETANSSDFFFGLTRGTRLLGFIQIAIRHEYINGTSSSPVGFIEGLYVREEFRRMGHGKNLVEFAYDFVRQLGCSEIASDVEVHNTRSQNFHESVGFTETERVVYYTRKLD